MTTDATFLYRNHTGRIAVRHVRDIRLEHGKTSYYPEPGFFLTGHDLDRDEERSFALKNILCWKGSDEWVISGEFKDLERMTECLRAWGEWCISEDGHGGTLFDKATSLMPEWAMPDFDEDEDSDG